MPADFRMFPDDSKTRTGCVYKDACIFFFPIRQKQFYLSLNNSHCFFKPQACEIFPKFLDTAKILFNGFKIGAGRDNLGQVREFTAQTGTPVKICFARLQWPKKQGNQLCRFTLHLKQSFTKTGQPR